MRRRRAFFYVQHLLGIGHLRRTSMIANALAAQGVDVTLASGGFPVQGLRVEGIHFVQLPPAAAADFTFKAIVDEHKMPIEDEWRSRRRALLLDAWRASDPHVVVVELFPFGRRQMRFELVPLLDAVAKAERRPLVVSSVRDVLGSGQKNPARQDEMLEMFERYFDHVLVHGDPAVIPFGTTFRHADKITQKLHYTGYVAESASPQAGRDGAGLASDPEVIVSAGGGAVGMWLFETAIRARTLSVMGNATWRILCGVNTPAADFGHIAEMARSLGKDRVIVERAREDFPALLARCAVSISQAGYNTMLDILQAGARSVVVPFAGGGEIEQTVRALAFAEQGLVEMVSEEELTPQRLAAAVDRAALAPRPICGRVDLQGAGRSAELLCDWMREWKW